jgi:hypothetical protein
LTLSTERGGVGIAFSIEQAREAVGKQPTILTYTSDTNAKCWSMLTATKDGLGLSPEEARKCILRSPTVLLYDHDDVVQRLGLLKSLGYAEARALVLTAPYVLNFKEETVIKHAAWLKQSGLDHVKLVTSLPILLGAPTTTEMQAKLDFLSRVVGTSKDELNKAASLFALSLDGRLQARYFYALLKHRLVQFTSKSTLMKVTDASFLAMVQGGTCRGRASKAEVERYRKLVTSAKFVAWRERKEARILRRSTT